MSSEGAGTAEACSLMFRGTIMLGSRSPQRLKLLRKLIPADRIVVAPAASDQEQGFGDCRNLNEIHERVLQIARDKAAALEHEWRASTCDLLLTADTVVIAQPRSEYPQVLGKPDGTDWQTRVRGWFQDYYSGRAHNVVTAIVLRGRAGDDEESLASTQVEMHCMTDEQLDWYIATGEPLGKAGGYALQGAGSVFVTGVRGSLSNVIGLPLEAVREALCHRDDAYAS